MNVGGWHSTSSSDDTGGNGLQDWGMKNGCGTVGIRAEELALDDGDSAPGPSAVVASAYQWLRLRVPAMCYLAPGSR